MINKDKTTSAAKRPLASAIKAMLPLVAMAAPLAPSFANASLRNHSISRYAGKAARQAVVYVDQGQKDKRVENKRTAEQSE